MQLNFNLFEEYNTLKESAYYAGKACDLGFLPACAIAGSIYYPDYYQLDNNIEHPKDIKLSKFYLFKGCQSEIPDIGRGCHLLSRAYFEHGIDSITLEQAYEYGINGCLNYDRVNCEILFNGHDMNKNIPDVESRPSLLIRIYVADWYWNVVLAPPPPPSEWGD